MILTEGSGPGSFKESLTDFEKPSDAHREFSVGLANPAVLVISRHASQAAAEVIRECLLIHSTPY